MDLALRRRTAVLDFQGIPLEIRELSLKNYIRLLEILSGFMGRVSLSAGTSDQAAALKVLAEGFPDALLEILGMSMEGTGIVVRKWYGLLGRKHISRAAILEASPSEAMGLLWKILELNDVLEPLKKKLQAAGIVDRIPSTKPSPTAPESTATAPSGSGITAPAGA